MRKILSFMVFMILIGVAEVWAEPVYIDPPNQTVGVGDTIDIDVAISGVSNLRGYQLSLEYSPSILELVSVSNGPFLGSDAFWVAPDILTPGLILNAAATKLGESGPSGSGVLVEVQFRAIASGTSQINLSDAILIAKVGENFVDVPAEISNGSITVTGGGPITFDLNLLLGWNMISIPLVPANNDISVVLASIDGMYGSVWAYDTTLQVWRLYAVGLPFISDLSTVEPGTGYWIMMTEPATLNLNGTGITAPGIQLYKGWNLVGYNSQTPRDVQGAMSSINGIYKSVWTYEPISGGWLYYIVGAPDFLNSLTQLEPGRSYWIEVDSDCVWDVSR